MRTVGHRRRWLRTAAVAAGALATTIAPAWTASAAETGPAATRPVERPADTGQGTETAGLVRDARCGAAFRIADVPGGVRCSHGADPAPAGVDVGRRPSTEELYAESTAASGGTATGGGVPCYGDGVSGKRVQAVYARAADVSDRYGEVAPLIRQWAAAVDTVFSASAAETGGDRHVRWVTDASCELVVQPVTLSASGDDSMSNTINELRALGLNRTDRKYLVWTDATVYCGIAEFRMDDSASATNGNNWGPSVARVDSMCWGRGAPVEAHELMHTLGGVQNSAPNSTGQAHCTDESDIMCYADSSGRAMVYVCEGSHEARFDCNHDDYYSTAPPAGSYLATHWNTASSEFLAATADGGGSGGGGGSGETTPPPPVETSYTGSVSRKAPSKSYAMTTGAGPLSSTLTFGKRVTLTLSLVAPDGSVLASRTGTSPLALSTTVAAGSHRLVVSSSGASASFTLAVTHQAP